MSSKAWSRDEMIGPRLAFSITLLLGGLFSPVGAEAQQAAKIARIGYLTLSLAAAPHLREAFLQGLRDLGYVEGRNVVIEYRDAEGKYERLPALAAELVALKVDVIRFRTISGPVRTALRCDAPQVQRCYADRPSPRPNCSWADKTCAPQFERSSSSAAAACRGKTLRLRMLPSTLPGATEVNP